MRHWQLCDERLINYLVRRKLCPYIWAINEQQHAMSHLFTPCINEQVVALVTRAFDADGMLVSKGKRNNQKEARAILESGADTSGYVGRYEAHTSILIIAYPSRAI